MYDSISAKWQDILNRIKTEYDITDISFKTWIEPLKINSVNGNVVELVTPDNQMSVDVLNKKYYLFFKVTISEIMNKEMDIKFISSSSLPSNKVINTNMDMSVYLKSNINPKYTFDSFIKGSNNDIALNASLAVAESPASGYNPLFLHGGVGLGKTHLMNAIGNFVIANNPEAKVLYVTSETFTIELIESIRNNTTSQFREKYRNIDVLLIDDIQFIIGKESTQEEFFHTFNTLFNASKQIVISSDRSPKAMTTLEERLTSRFEMGLTVDIQSPTYETRMAILRKKLSQDSLNIPEKVLDYIALNIKSNVRELEGALNKVVSYSRFSNNSEITLESVEYVLKDMISPDEKVDITPELIIKVVAEHFNISADDICSTKKNQEIAFPRQIVMYLCRTMTEVPLQAIGKALGKKDHTTVIHGSKKISEEITHNESLKNTIEVLKKKIYPS
ncbi:MAG: chromosomal replication initiator protein DnaA [Lachnospira sp.]|nr:chromosomal replication initiator protein DnaA [Lachnospira sp.]